MTSKERLVAALTGKLPDRLPVTTHHILSYYLQKHFPGKSDLDFFDEFKLDAISWGSPQRPAHESNDYFDPLQGNLGFLESRRVANDSWRIFTEDASVGDRKLTRYRFVTPAGSLDMLIEDAGYTAWVVEPLIKQKRDIDLIGAYVYAPLRCRCGEPDRERIRPEGHRTRSYLLL